MSITNTYLNTAAQDLAGRVTTLRINDVDNFAVDSSVAVNNIVIAKIRLSGYVNNSVNNLKLLDGSSNIISEKVVSTAIDSSVNIEDIQYDFPVERKV